MKSIQDIRTDLFFIRNHEVVIFGSFADKKADKRSDIDIAVIIREKGRGRCMEIWKEIIGRAPGIYDIKIFELLPLHIKHWKRWYCNAYTECAPLSSLYFIFSFIFKKLYLPDQASCESVG